MITVLLCYFIWLGGFSGINSEAFLEDLDSWRWASGNLLGDLTVPWTPPHCRQWRLGRLGMRWGRSELLSQLGVWCARCLVICHNHDLSLNSSGNPIHHNASPYVPKRSFQEVARCDELWTKAKISTVRVVEGRELLQRPQIDWG